MKFRPVQTFWEAYAALPTDIKERAREAFLRFQDGAEHPPFHPALRIRKMQGHPDIWEGHISLQYEFALTNTFQQLIYWGQSEYLQGTTAHSVYSQPTTTFQRGTTYYWRATLQCADGANAAG